MSEKTPRPRTQPDARPNKLKNLTDQQKQRKLPPLRLKKKTIPASASAPVAPTERDLQAPVHARELVLPIEVARRRLTWALLTTLGVLIAAGMFLFLYIYNAARPAVFSAQAPVASNQFIRSIYHGDKLDLSEPNDVAVAANGDLYVADTGNARIAVFDAQGNFLRQFAKGDPARAAKNAQTDKKKPLSAASGLISPTSIAVGSNNQVYVVDSALNELVIYMTDGTLVKEVKFKEESPIGVSFAQVRAADGRIVVTTKSGIAIANADGKFMFAYLNWGSKLGQMDNPASALLTFSHETTSTLYVCDTLNYRIQALTDIETSPTVSWTYGAALPVKNALQYNGASRKFGLPVSLALTANGDLVVVDGLSGELIVLDAHTGGYLRTVTSMGNEDGQLYYPVGVAASQEQIYVADKYNDRIEIFSDTVSKNESPPPVRGGLKFDPAWLLVIPLLLMAVALLRQVFLRTPRYTLDMRFIEQVAADEDCRELLLQLRKVRVPLQLEVIAQRKLPDDVQLDVVVGDPVALDALQDEDPQLSELEAAAIQVAAHTGRRDYFLVGDPHVAAHSMVAKVQQVTPKEFFTLAKRAK
ncbi:MAG: NHL repeat-containing protein [Coriobacteriia bacterium]|nr:NHL repeat-containing protein [Coriobacteriia bacterium]